MINRTTPRPILARESSQPERRRSSRIALAIIGAFAGAFLIGFAPLAASAGTANSTTGYFTSSGYSYKNYAQVITSTNQARALTYTGPTATTVPSGYVGSQGRLFTTGGSLSCAGSTSYSNQSLIAGGLWSGTSCSRGAGNWYSYGLSLTFNGSGYNTTYTFQSPAQSA